MTALSPIKENCCCKFFGIEDSVDKGKRKNQNAVLGLEAIHYHISRNAHTIKHKSEAGLYPSIELIETTTKFEFLTTHKQLLQDEFQARTLLFFQKSSSINA